MKNICVIGSGYVGLVTGTCFADLGNRVVILDIDESKIAMLKRGDIPIYEPGLKEMVQRNVGAGRLSFTTSYPEGLKEAEIVFIAVGTPEGVDGEADLRYVRMAAESIAQTMDHPLIIVNKSTVPVGTGDWVANIVKEHQKEPIPFAVVSNPEFLREGSAISDFMTPDRIVLGSTDEEAMDKVAQLYMPLRSIIMTTDLPTAEMIKYASNAFLATRISFINEIANICERYGADVKEVAAGMGYDKRIGKAFLDAGLGYGGSCFAADETVFVLNSPHVVAEPLDTLFAKQGEPLAGDGVEVVLPPYQRVLAFDLLTAQPVLAEVKALTRRPYKGCMVTLRMTMGRSLRVTADHPVIVQTDSGITIHPAAAVRPGDRLMALCALPTVEPAAELNLLDLLRGTSLEQDVYVAPTDKAFAQAYPRFARSMPSAMLRHPHEIKRHNRLSLRLYRHLQASGVLDMPAERLQLYTAKGAATKINAVIPVDADLLRLCGYYLAEGSIGQDSGRAGAVWERVGFSFHENEAEYIADVERILSRWGMKCSKWHRGHTVTVVVFSRILAWLLRDVLRCGTRSDDKTLPRLAFNVPAALRQELLRGAFSGDGVMTTVQNGRNMVLEYSTVSKPLADGMALLLQTLGVVPFIGACRMNKSKQPAYILRVSGYEQIAALVNILGETRRAQIASGLSGYQQHIRQRGFARQGPYALLTVLSAEHEEVDTTVYSLETSTGTVIAASGLICHNCFPKDVKALERMGTAHGFHPQLLRAVMEINQDQRRKVIRLLEELLPEGLQGTTVGLLGLAFKPNTDDMREAPSVEIAHMLWEKGAQVKGYDPVAMPNAARVLPKLQLEEDPYDLATGADALIVVTEWNEFKQLDLQRIRAAMRQPVMVDGRNIYDPAKMRSLGFRYRGIGRGYEVNGPAR